MLIYLSRRDVAVLIFYFFPVWQGKNALLERHSQNETIRRHLNHLYGSASSYRSKVEVFAVVFVMERMHKTVYLAGGCFWGIEAYLKSLFGVQRVRSGYANGKTKNPNYKEVVTGETGFVETVEVVFDPVIMPLAVLISHFFRIIDPTTLNRQGNDFGTQYRTGIYYCDPLDKELLQKMLHLLQKDQKKPIVVELLPIENFYPAEEYHQDYLAKNPFGYCHIDLSLVDERFIPKYPYLLDNVEEKRRALSGKKRFIGCEQGTEPLFLIRYGSFRSRESMSISQVHSRCFCLLTNLTQGAVGQVFIHRLLKMCSSRAKTEVMAWSGWRSSVH